jgi:hypothetical protein
VIEAQEQSYPRSVHDCLVLAGAELGGYEAYGRRVRYRLVPGVWEGGCVDVAGRQLLRSTHGSRIIPYGASWAQADRFEPFAVRSWVGVRWCSRCGDQPGSKIAQAIGVDVIGSTR